MEDLQIEKTLDRFVVEWRAELSSSDREGGLLGKRGERGDGCGVELVEVPSEKRPVAREPSPLLVLPAGARQKTVSAPVRERKECDVRPSAGSLLDILIADLVRSSGWYNH